MLANLSDSDRRALRFGGFGVAGILLFMLVVSPLMARWDKLDAAYASDQKQLLSIQDAVGSRVGSIGAMQDLREKATVYNRPADLNAQTAAMMQQVERLPAYRTLAVPRLEGLPVRDEDDFYHSGLSLQFSGTLGGLHAFLQQMEQAKPVLKVDRLTVTTDRKDPSRIDGSMTISGYAVVLGKGKNG